MVCKRHFNLLICFSSQFAGWQGICIHISQGCGTILGFFRFGNNLFKVQSVLFPEGSSSLISMEPWSTPGGSPGEKPVNGEPKVSLAEAWLLGEPRKGCVSLPRHVQLQMGREILYLLGHLRSLKRQMKDPNCPVLIQAGHLFPNQSLLSQQQGCLARHKKNAQARGKAGPALSDKCLAIHFKI